MIQDQAQVNRERGRENSLNCESSRLRVLASVVVFMENELVIRTQVTKLQITQFSINAALYMYTTKRVYIFSSSSSLIDTYANNCRRWFNIQIQRACVAQSVQTASTARRLWLKSGTLHF